jgi:putative membrane protein
MNEHDDAEPDYRFTLANERTFLAYIRTALALNGAGLAVVQFLTAIGTHHQRRIFGVLLIVSGLVTAVLGYRRWAGVQAAMRRNAPLPQSSNQLVLTGILILCSIAAMIALFRQ